VATILTIFPENKLTTMANLVPSKRKLVVWRILGGGGAPRLRHCSLMVHTTLQNSFSLTFPWLSRKKWIVFPD